MTVSGSAREPKDVTGRLTALDGRSRKQKRYLLRFEVFDEKMKLVHLKGVREYWFRFAWQAVWERTSQTRRDDPAVGVWRIYDTKKGGELI